MIDFIKKFFYRAMLLSAAVTVASSETNTATLNLLLLGDIRPLIQWSPSASHFHKEIIHPAVTSGDAIR